MSESFRDLIAWQKAMDLVAEVYRSTEGFPSRERYGLTNQLRRASISVPSNIAEGRGRASRKEFIQFLAQARGSLLEVQMQLELSLRLGYLERQAFSRLDQSAAEVGRILNGLIGKIRSKVAEQKPRARKSLTADS